MPIQSSSSAMPLPRGWTSHVKSAVLQVIAYGENIGPSRKCRHGLALPLVGNRSFGRPLCLGSAASVSMIKI